MNVENRPAVIEAMTEQLRGLWEAQPTLSLAELWSQLGGLGIGLSATDAEIAAAMGELAALHPGSVAAAGWPDAGQSILLEVEKPRRRVTLTADGHLIARSREAQTVVWRVGRVLSSRARTSLVVEDESGMIHSLGEVQRITVLERQWELFGDDGVGGHGMSAAPLTELTGLTRSSLGDAVFVAALSDGTIVTIGHALRIDSLARRSAGVEFIRGWERLEKCRVGAALMIRGAGGSVVDGAVVDGLWRVE